VRPFLFYNNLSINVLAFYCSEMKTVLSLSHRLRWLNLPMGILVVLLQRTPVLRLLLQSEFAWETGAGDLLKSGFALAALGSLNSLAGATTFTVNGTSVAPKGTVAIAGTVGTALSFTFSVSGAPGTPKSFGVTDGNSSSTYTGSGANSLPPGLALNPSTSTTSGGAPYYSTSLKGTITGTPTTAGTYNVRLWACDSSTLSTNGNAAYVNASFTITGGAVAAPSISTQPAGLTVTAGSSASFSVTASGGGTLTYQWAKGGTAISGATGSTYSIAATTTSDAGNYTVTVTNSGGSVTSSAATLTVNAAVTAPSITTQPASATVNAGSAVSFSVTASGGGTLTYQWSKGGAAISGATGSTYSIASSATTDAGSYTVTVTNSAGSVTSGAATLTVNSAPTISTQPVSQSATAGSSVTFSVTASGSGTLGYQWQKGGVAISGATGSSYTIASVASADAATYTVAVSNAVGSVTSTGATLTVTASATAPAITAQPANVTVTAGSAASFSVTASGTSLAYQWTKGGVAISGATAATYTIAAAASTDAGTYAVKVSNSVGNVTSSGATLTVNAAASAPTITTQPASVTVTAGASASFSVSAAGTGTLTYQWAKGGTAISGATGATYTIAATVASDAATYTVTVSNATGSVTSSGATLTVNAASSGGNNTVPTVSQSPNSETVVSGHSVSFSGSAAGNPTPVYQWQVSTNSGGSWANLADDSTYSGTATGTLTVSSATSGLSGNQYRFAATNAAGAVNSGAATLAVVSAVLPGPVGLAVDASGNVWVSDSSSNIIELVSTSGTATLVAGSAGTQGATDGNGAAALFRQPGGMVLDSSGNAYVADTGNSVIRKVTSAGAVTTFAGSTSHQSYQDGTGTAAWFNAPASLAIDSANNLYVADTGNSAIRKITPAGAVTTIAGTAGTRGTKDGTGTAAQFNQPAGITVDASGTIYVADTVNQTIRKVTAAGVVTTWLGVAGVSGVSDGVGAAALFNLPTGLTLDGSGNLYVADTGNSAIRAVTPGGSVSTLAGLTSIAGFMDGTGGTAWLNQPKDVKYGGTAGVLYVADTGNAALRKLTLAGAVTTLITTPAATSSGSSGSTGTGTGTPSTGSSGSTATVSGTPQSAGNNGGGVPSLWFGAALTLLTVGRRQWRRAG